MSRILDPEILGPGFQVSVPGLWVLILGYAGGRGCMFQKCSFKLSVISTYF